jgi:major vault protein
MDDAEAEKARMNLLTLQGESAAVESTGQAKAEATGRAEAAKIEAMAAVEAAKLKAEAMTIESDSELARLKAAREAEIQFLNDQNRLEVEKAEKMAGIESAKFKAMVDVMGSDAIKSMASAPQDHQVKMLQALGLNSTLITDGKNPVNLFNTAQGLLGSITESNSK